MSALASIPPIEPRVMLPVEPASTSGLPTQPTQIDAFRSVLASAGNALTANPQAIGRALLSGLNNFSAGEAKARVQVQQAIDPTSNAAEAPEAGPLAGASPEGTPSPTASLLQKGEAIQQRSMGMMMQTYSFALEATMVSNAATTFTSSVNTLIKTQ